MTDEPINPFVDSYGTKGWYRNGQLHRLDGPAIICANGRQEWFQYGQRHRTDGPAIIRADGIHLWYIHGRSMTKEITSWMESNQMSWPWDEETQVFFELSWG